jgi:hypothetical protein
MSPAAALWAACWLLRRWRCAPWRAPAVPRRAVCSRLQATIGGGLALAIASGSVSLAMGQPFLTNVSFGVVSTVLLFDVGVFLIVVGMALLMLAAVAKEAP